MTDIDRAVELHTFHCFREATEGDYESNCCEECGREIADDLVLCETCWSREDKEAA